jgi:hypothetical protein
VSPTAPTFGTLNDQLTKAHRRIRELEARETELLAHNRTLRAVITKITHADHPRITAELTSSSQSRAPPRGLSLRPAHPERASTASKRGDSHMFDLDPIGAMFLIIAVLWLIAAVAYGRDDR